MILTINGKNYELHFGLGFLAKMNEMKPVEIHGMKTGYGSLALLNIGQALGDPLAFYDLVKAATAEAPQKPSNEELEAYLTQLIVENRLETVFGEILAEVKKSPILVYAMKIQENQDRPPLTPAEATIIDQAINQATSTATPTAFPY